MDPYRDNREALQARAAELDRLLAERRTELAALKFARLVAQAKWLIPAVLLVAFAGATLMRSRPRKAPLLTTERWRARVVTSNHMGVHPGTICEVELAAPCSATILCGPLAYHGTGFCERGNYRDDSDTSIDGNPLCEIVGSHVMLREFFKVSNQSRHQNWAIELERW